MRLDLGISGNTRNNNTLLGLSVVLFGLATFLFGLLPWLAYDDPIAVLRNTGRPTLELVLFLLAHAVAFGMIVMGIPCWKKGMLNKASPKQLMSWFGLWLLVDALIDIVIPLATAGGKRWDDLVLVSPLVAFMVMQILFLIATITWARKHRGDTAAL